MTGEQKRYPLTRVSFSDHTYSYNVRPAFLTSSPFSALWSAVGGVYKQTHPFTDLKIGSKSVCRSLRLNEVVIKGKTSSIHPTYLPLQIRWFVLCDSMEETNYMWDAQYYGLVFSCTFSQEALSIPTRY